MSFRGKRFNHRGGDFSPRRSNPNNFPQRGRWGNKRQDWQPNDSPARGRGLSAGRNVHRGSFRRDNNVKQDTPGKRLTEREIGTTEYTSTLEGFSGIIKSRYSDFQVNEINMQGELAKLTDLKVPRLENNDVNKDGDEDLLILNKYNVELLPVEIWDKISALALSTENSTEKIEVDATEMSKDERTAIHNAVKKVFGAKIVGSTVGAGEKKSIVFSKYYKGVRVDNREKWLWPGEYVHFLVHKENCDTMEAASRISMGLHMGRIKPALFGYCGTKDRRAKTTQWFSIKKVDPTKIQKGCKNIRNVLVGNFTFKDYHLNLGSLKGNRIALRNVTADDELIESAVENVKNNGFINYYGLQRFGSRADAPTYMIGRCLLQGKYREAINIILAPHGTFAYQLQLYQNTKDPHAALDAIPRYASMSIEVKLLMGLAACAQNDLLAALDRIPRNTRLLYIHSYQSWIWNRCVSERIKRFGLVCQVGDLVPLNPTEMREDDESKDIDDSFIGWSSYEGEDDASADNEKNTDSAKVEDSSEQQESKKCSTSTEKIHVRVRALTEQDIENKTHTIYDVVLPLPGYSIEYPLNLKDFYLDILKEDNLDLELRQTVKQYSLSGTYRRLMAKTENLKWETIRYDDPFCDLILSDADELNGKKPPKSLPDGKYKALVLDFSLLSSTYATMALREILKQDTSSETQAQNNDYYKQPQIDETEKTEDDQKLNPDTLPTSTDQGVIEEVELPTVEKRKATDEDDGVDVKKTKIE